jgi:hypothetical protein
VASPDEAAQGEAQQEEHAQKGGKVAQQDGFIGLKDADAIEVEVDRHGQHGEEPADLQATATKPGKTAGNLQATRSVRLTRWRRGDHRGSILGRPGKAGAWPVRQRAWLETHGEASLHV